MKTQKRLEFAHGFKSVSIISTAEKPPTQGQMTRFMKEMKMTEVADIMIPMLKDTYSRGVWRGFLYGAAAAIIGYHLALVFMGILK